MLNDALIRYIELRRSLGSKPRSQYVLLRNFVEYATANGDDFIRAERVLNWAILAPSAPQRRNRLLTVRRFATASRMEDPRHELPAADAMGRSRFRRRLPYIYQPEDIGRLIREASLLKPSGTLRPLMYSTLFGLLAATGMRVSEALSLRLDDVTSDGLLIRDTKFRKSRLLPLHETTRRALERCLLVRAGMSVSHGFLFICNSGTPLAYPTVVATFLKLVRSLGLRAGPGEPGPRIHDLRHTFAVRSLERCQREGEEVSRHAVALSAYLGDGHVTDTYWYLQATPILMRHIAKAGEIFYQGGDV